MNLHSGSDMFSVRSLRLSAEKFGKSAKGTEFFYRLFYPFEPRIIIRGILGLRWQIEMFQKFSPIVAPIIIFFLDSLRGHPV